MAPPFLTPTDLPVERKCTSIQIPDTREWLGIFDNLLLQLTQPWLWEQRIDSAVTIDDTIAFWENVVATYWDEQSCAVPNNAPTPFWDEDSDVDDEFPADAQPWYGTVPDPEDTQENIELDFVENFLIWSITGFLAVATWEIGAAPAILFSTIAPKFTLAMKRGDVGEVIRILVDGSEAARIDTTSAAAGDVIRVPILADPELTTHNIAIVQVS